MPEIRKVIADTSVLIAFEKLKLLDLLCSVYDQILLPLAVFSEYSNETRSCLAVAQAPDGLSKMYARTGNLGTRHR
jgi:predicted nucleic acid-binding protein